jgi:geranylgeranyl pyrophosphate synthase
VSALQTVRATEGLAEYLGAVERRLADVVDAHPGIVASVGSDALSAGGKRLRPTLTFLSAAPHAEPPVVEGAAVELVHMATLVHDDIVDGAHLRRGRASAWTAHGADAAKAAGDHLFAAAFALLAATGSHVRVTALADASLALARGEALQRRQAYRPDTTVDEYLMRCSLKTGKLFEAACVIGGARPELGDFGLALGVAFQIADDILDCTGDFDTTGKAPGVDLRDGTPTLPLILAAREDERVRRALAGEQVDGALERVAATGAIETARAFALEYAARARAALDGEPDRASLEALTHLVVDRDG